MLESRDLSRRDFLAAAAAGLVVGARDARGGEMNEALPADDQLLYVGTYTEDTRSEGIYILRMDRRTGALRRVGAVDAGPNPSFLALHPNGRALYAVNEVAKFDGKPTGGVTAFAITGATGALTRRNHQSSGGEGPCFVSVDHSGRVALVANYDGGSIALVPIETDGSIAPPAQVVHHTGSGPVTDRQAGPHAHCIIADRTNRFALASDLGADRVFVYHLDPTARTLRHVAGGDAVMRGGTGPRHLVFHPTLPLLFVANELASTVASFRFDPQRGTLSPIDAQSTVPAGWKGENETADIHIAPSGRTVYVSNRGPNIIAVYSATDSGALALEQTIPTGGDWPRNFGLDPSGRWLLVANQKSNSIVVFSRDQSSGRLTPTQQRIELPSPVCIRFR
jgi:6-phosphogluconolactonase